MIYTADQMITGDGVTVIPQGAVRVDSNGTILAAGTRGADKTISGGEGAGFQRLLSASWTDRYACTFWILLQSAGCGGF